MAADSMGNVIPISIRRGIGSKIADVIEEDIRLSKQPRRKEPTNSSFLGTVKRGFDRTFNLKTSETPKNVNVQEMTYRGVSYTSPSISQYLTEYRPFDALTPEVIDQMKRNGVIKTGLFLKKAPILAVMAKARISHPNPRVEAFLQHVMKDLLYTLCQSSLFALDYGVSLHEKVFIADKLRFQYVQNGVNRTFNGDALYYKKIKWNNPRTIKEIRIQDRTQDFDGYTQSAGAGNDVIVEAYKAFMFGKSQENSLWGTSDLEPVYEYWYWLELISGYYMRYLEKLGTPPLVGYAPNGVTYSKDADTTVENISWLAELATRLHDGLAIVMPSAFDPNSRNRLWELKEMALSSRGDLYQTAITWLEGAILKGLFVPDKPVSSGNNSIGSYAMADVQFEAFLVGEEWDLKSFLQHVNKYVIRPLIDLNFGPQVQDAAIDCPPLSRELKQRVFDIFKDLVDSHPDFARVNFTEMAEEIGVPLYSEFEMKAKKEEAFEDGQRVAEAAAKIQSANQPNQPAQDEEKPQEDANN